MLDMEKQTETILSGVYSGNKTSWDLSFDAAQSYLLLDIPHEKPISQAKPEAVLTLQRNFKITEQSPNALTLDCCEYRIDQGNGSQRKQLFCFRMNC